jgi:transposase-like protein
LWLPICRVESDADHRKQCFQWRAAPGELIVMRALLSAVPFSYEHVMEMMAEQGVEVDASWIWRWVQAYAPELNKRCPPHVKPVNKSYRVNATYIKVKGSDRYRGLYSLVLLCYKKTISSRIVL